MPEQTQCVQCMNVNHDSKFCQQHVVSPLVPEKWRLSDDNKEGSIEQPHCICRGPPSTFFVCNKSVVYSIRLHYPVQVKVVAGTFEMVSCIAYNNGILIISHLDMEKVSFYDYLSTLTPKVPGRKEELKTFLAERNIVVDPRAGVKELKSKAKDYINNHGHHDDTLIKIEGVTALAFCAPDLLYLGSTAEDAVLEVSLSYKDFKVEGNILRRLPFPNGEHYVPGSLCLVNSKLFLTNLAVNGGLIELDLETAQHSKMLHNSPLSTAHGLAAVGSTIYFSDIKSRQIKYFHIPISSREPDVKPYAGNGDSVRKYGFANMASFGQPSSIVAEGNSLIVCDTGVNAITLVSSMKPLYLATQQFSSLYDAFGVHSNNKHIAASDALQAVENSLQFYRECQADVRELFELAPNKSLDGSLGSPSHETVNSLAMVQRGLKEAIDDLSDMSQNEDLKFVTKALPTLVNEHVFAKARELGFNEAVGCLDFAINFPTIVDEVMKRISKLPFIFYTHPKSYYEVPIDFVKFEEMPTIPKPQHLSLPSHEIAKLHDYRKKWLEAVRVATVRSETSKHKFTTLPIALYETEPPQNADLDFSFFLSGRHTPVFRARKVLFYNGTVFHKSSKENEVLMVAGEDIFDVGSPITADIFIQDRDNSLHFSWSCTRPAASLGTFVATSIELHSSVEGAVGEGITLTEDQFEELQTVRQDISDSTDVDSDESDQELEEQIGQCNMPARTRCSRRVRVPARYHDFL